MIQRYKAHIGLGHFQMCFDEDVAKLEAENERLRKALEDIKDISYPADVYFIALKALEDK